VSYSKTMDMGRLVRDPDLRNTASGSVVANFTLAINRKRSNGEESVAFVDFVMWGPRAEAFVKHHSKGDMCFIVGRHSMDEWESDGVKRTKLKVTAEEWVFVK
jgi:single-strand DNA-binding protein